MPTVYLYSPNEASFVERLCNSCCRPAFRCVLLTPIPPIKVVAWFGTLLKLFINWPPDTVMLFRFALGTASSDVEEARELHEPPWVASDRTGDALRRIVSSINCFAQLENIMAGHRSKHLLAILHIKLTLLYILLAGTGNLD